MHRWFYRSVEGLDRHNGTVTAVATVVMTAFTGLLAQYARNQEKIVQLDSRAWVGAPKVSSPRDRRR